MAAGAPAPALVQPLAGRLPAVLGTTALRRLASGDLERFHACRSDAELARLQGWEPMSRDAALGFVQAMSTVDALLPGGWIQLAIAASDSDALLGDVGLFLEAEGDEAEIGFTLHRDSQHQGHATRATRLAADLAFATTGVRCIRAVTDVRNAASVAVLRRAGFVLVAERRAAFKGEPCDELVFALPRTHSAAASRHAAFDIAPAQPADAAACVRLRSRTRENAVSAERLRSLGITVESWGADIASGRLRGWMARLGPHPVGYCFGDSTSGEVVVLALLPEVEDHGLGRALLARVVAELRRLGHTTLHLGCAADPALRSWGFYRHLGWRSSGRFDARGDEILLLEGG